MDLNNEDEINAEVTEENVAVNEHTEVKETSESTQEETNNAESETTDVETSESELTATEDTTEVENETSDVEQVDAELNVSSDETDRPVRGRRGRGKKQKIETYEEKPQSEWTERVVQIRRVTKVVKGGKKLSFRAVVIVGNKKGQVGVGCAKAAEVIIAIQKAIADGRKNLISVPIFKTTIPHPITGRSGAGEVMLRPAAQGTGIIAGGAVRLVLELAGIENILSKSLGSKSPLNAANATLDALKQLTPFSEVAKKRGLTMAQLLN